MIAVEGGGREGKGRDWELVWCGVCVEGLLLKSSGGEEEEERKKQSRGIF